MAQIALITGASSGLGAELARLHAARGGDLIIVARRAEALARLKDELENAHGVQVQCLALDLAAPGGVERLCTALDEAGAQIDILINNAGFGGHGQHIERPLEAELEMVDLNVKAVVALTHRIGGAMARRGGGRILNIGSTAGMMPGPLQAVYFASKAFVNSFSQAIDEELRPFGVTCTVLAPGYVPTEFAARAGLDGTPLTRRGMAAPAVAKIGYDAMLKGRLLVVNERRLSFALNWLIPFLPRRMVLHMVRKMQSKSRADATPKPSITR